ncbi:LacI family DNA-binding transcriptional regulator [Kiritimatiellaeota bacterium B1221]|nr:LacI family DNA-binding transcriptional regulator [Kiritimatiellaeota bacterium B1221]
MKDSKSTQASTDVPRMVDIARAAGVHQSTVSRALRGDPALPEVTRKRLSALAERMGYRPNPLVSALIAERRRGRRSGRGSVLAVLSAGKHPEAWRENPQGSYAQLYEYMKTHAHRLGYGLEEYALDDPHTGGPKRLQQILLSRGIRGILLAPMPLEVNEIDFDLREFAAVALRLYLQRPLLDRVTPDYFSVMYTALEKLNATGHRRVGFLSNSEVDERVRHRSLGAYLVKQQAVPAQYYKPMIYGDWSDSDFLAWVQKGKLDAVVTSIYPQYLRAQQCLVKNGWTLPRDLSLICLDCHADTEEAGMQHNLEQEAVSAINFLTKKVESADFGVPAQSCRLSIPGRWRDGALCVSRG